MKNLAPTTFRPIYTALGLLLSLSVNRAGAANQFWDNNGTSTPTAGVWDNTSTNWANSTTLVTSRVAFTSGNFANFTGGSANISNLTITVNTAVICSGLGTGTSDGIGANTVTNLTLSGTGSIAVTNGQQNINCDNANVGITIAVPLTGPGGIIQHGNGYIAFQGSNSYAGGTTLTGGQVVYYYNNASFGSGPVTNSGSPGGAMVNNTSPSAALTIPNNFYWASGNNNALNLAGGFAVGGNPGTTFSGNFNLNSGNTILYTSNNTNVIAITGIISGSGATPLVEDNGTMQMGGANTYSGNTGIASPAMLIINGSGSLGGGNYAYNITNGFNAIGITNGSKLVFASSTPQILSGIVSGGGLLIVSNNANLTLSGANIYTNSTVLDSGILNVTNVGDDGFANIGGPLTWGGGTLNYSGPGDVTARTATGVSGATSTIVVPTNVTVELDGPMTGAAKWTVSLTGGGTLIIGGYQNNSYFGMNITNGTVILNKTGPSGNAIGSTTTVGLGGVLQLSGGGYGAEIYNGTTTTITVTNGGLFDMNGQNNSIYGVTLSGMGPLINSAASTSSTLTSPVALAAAATIGSTNSLGNITVAGPISGYLMPLTYAGVGMLTLDATNTYSGGTFVSAGILDGGLSNSIPDNVTITGSGGLELDDPNAMAPTATISLPPTNGIYLNFSGTQNIAGLIIGGTNQPPGTYGAVGTPGVAYQNAAFTGGGILNVVQAYWDANGTDAGAQTNTFGGGTGSWDDASTDWWITGNMDTNWPAGNVAYFAGTPGTVTLNASESAAGLVFLSPGYVITNTDGVSVLTLSGGTQNITVPAGAPTSISCEIAGGGPLAGLTVSGPGTLALSGSNSYAGGTAISGGATLTVNSVSDTNASALVLPVTMGTIGGPGANLVFTGASGQTTNNVILNGATSNTLLVPTNETLEVDGQIKNGTITAVPGIVFSGGGTMYMGGISNDNAGLTLSIASGEVIINKTTYASAHGLGGGASSVGVGTPGNSAELKLAGSGSADLYSGCILTVNSPDGFLDLNGQGDSMSTLTLSGAGPNGTGALINSAPNSSSSLTNGGSGVVLAGNTTIGGGGNIALTSKVSGGYSLTYAGTATLTLSNVNSFSAGTIINAGGTLFLTNSASSAGTGPISVGANATLDVGILGNNVLLANQLTGSGVINAFETTNDNLQFGGSMSSFTGALNCPAGLGTSKVQILTTAVAINSGATINVAAGGTLYVANSGVTVACPINLHGIGNAEVYGALRIESGALISGPVVLSGNTTMGNSGSGPSKLATISGPISQPNGVFGITFTAEPGTIVLSGTNTYSGPTTNNMTLSSSNSLTIGGAGQLGSGNYSASFANNGVFKYASSSAQTLSGVISGTGPLIQSGPGILSLAGTNVYTGATVITNGGTLGISGSGSLGNGVYAGNITNYGVFAYASSAAQTLSGVISGTGSLNQNGPGKLTLAGANTYTGATTIIYGGALALANSGSINNSGSLNIGAGATFDVSAYALSFSLGGNTIVTASGTGAAPGSTAASINGGSSGTVTLGSLALNFTPQSFASDLTHPALYVQQGGLALTAGVLAVNNASGTPLGAGTYSLIQVAGEVLNAAYTNVTVSGAGLAPNTAASLAVSGGSLNLVVSNSIVPVPAINNITISGANLIFSGTNGTGGGNYYVLTTTNLALPRSQWTIIATNMFNPDGSFNATNPLGQGPGFFIIRH